MKTYFDLFNESYPVPSIFVRGHKGTLYLTSYHQSHCRLSCTTYIVDLTRHDLCLLFLDSIVAEMDSMAFLEGKWLPSLYLSIKTNATHWAYHLTFVSICNTTKYLGLKVNWVWDITNLYRPAPGKLVKQSTSVPIQKKGPKCRAWCVLAHCLL